MRKLLKSLLWVPGIVLAFGTLNGIVNPRPEYVSWQVAATSAGFALAMALFARELDVD